MAKHEIYNQFMDVPEGYKTYSALLIPDYEWFNKVGLAGAYKFFNRFKRVGEIIGDDHLTFWFYHDWFGYGRLVDSEVIAAIGHHISSVEELKKFTTEHFEKGAQQASQGSYDIERARLICHGLSLSYSAGPYVAFFSKRPILPYRERTDEGVVIKNGNTYTSPEFVLRFGGLEPDRCLELLDELEQQLLSEKFDTSQLKWKQVWFRIEQWCGKHQDLIVAVLKGVVAKSIRGPV
ncbi:MAG: hypothetical protein LAO76_21540 [Acidobacteriia bacterium]|nr:hypothetical protein [Terriglobia bacterium]